MESPFLRFALSALFLTSLCAGAQAQEMPAMAKKLGCTACHAIDHKIVGPAWKDVADRYTGQGVKTFKFKDKEYPLIEGLVMKVSQGGAGNWGTVPMLANDPKGVHKEDITELVKFEQGLATKK
jgi:cytochrome c551/c552